MSKTYCLDTNALLSNPELVQDLINAGEKVVVPLHTVLELDSLKRKAHLRDRISDVTTQLLSNLENITILDSYGSTDSELAKGTTDLQILNDIQQYSYVPDTALVTSDRLMQVLAHAKGIATVKPCITGEEPLSPSEKNTGFVQEGKDTYPNSFMWEQGKPVYHKANGEKKVITYSNEVWKLTPKSVYQNLAMELMLDPDVDLVTLQSPAGYGKTMCALAAALYLTFEKKLYEKIYVIKSTKEVEDKLGYLPGDKDDKISPYFMYLDKLLEKLHSLRPANRIWADPKDRGKGYDTKHFETAPIQFLRGANIENAVVIVDESQNISRYGIRTVLTRMGQNVKCVCLGDVRQIDNENLNAFDNGLSWVVKKCLGAPNYAHLVMKGQCSRGPITDLILQREI